VDGHADVRDTMVPPSGVRGTLAKSIVKYLEKLKIERPKSIGKQAIAFVAFAGECALIKPFLFCSRRTI